MGNAEFPVGDTGSGCAVGRQKSFKIQVCSGQRDWGAAPPLCMGDYKCIERTLSSSASLPLDVL
jgi:hypothetical protein